MVQITRDQKDFLIKNKYLKLKNGKYPDLTIASKEKKSKRKNYYVPDFYLNYLKNNNDRSNDNSKNDSKSNSKNTKKFNVKD